MAYQYMPKIFHDHHKNPPDLSPAPPPPTYLMYGPLPRVNNFDIKQKKWNICFIICHQHLTRSGKIKTNKTQQISFKTQGFLCKN